MENIIEYMAMATYADSAYIGGKNVVLFCGDYKIMVSTDTRVIDKVGTDLSLYLPTAETLVSASQSENGFTIFTFTCEGLTTQVSFVNREAKKVYDENLMAMVELDSIMEMLVKE